MTRLDAALAAIDNSLPQYADDSQQLVAAKCRGLLRGYDARWVNAGYAAVDVERFIEADLWNPETQAKSRTFRLAGKIDLLAEMNGRSYLFDHKTTSHDIADPDSPYWRQLVVEGQVDHYLLLLWLNGQRVDNVVWDVVRKPGISPKKLSKADRASVASLGTYCDERVSDASRQSLTNDDRETLEMYELRLAKDCTFERPEWYFQRRNVPRLDAEIFAYAQEIWGHSQDILATRRFDRHVRNSGACMLYGSACKFLGICSGHDTPDSDKWRRKEVVHAELPIVNGDGRDILTNSRIRCFQTCRRKHQYDYEIGIERYDAEEKEALFFGSLWHSGISEWWRFDFRGQNECRDTTHKESNCVS